MDRNARGVGPGSITRDGCAVEVYARLPDNGEPAIIDDAIPPGSRILELGCGAGRLSNPLVELGHQVVGVDDSADMLEHLVGVVPVCRRIEDLRLAERFDVVVLASHLINTPDVAQRRALLAACRCHVKPVGQAVVQWHPPAWFDGLSAGARREATLGGVVCLLHVLAVADDLLSAEVYYRIGDLTWTQWFAARRLTEDELADELAAAGLAVHRWLDPDRQWFTASPGPHMDRRLSIR